MDKNTLHCSEPAQSLLYQWERVYVLRILVKATVIDAKIQSSVSLIYKDYERRPQAFRWLDEDVSWHFADFLLIASRSYVEIPQGH